MEKVGPTLKISELTSNISPKQLSKLLLQIGTQFGARNSPNTSMQPKPQCYAKNNNNGSSYLQEFTRNGGPIAVTNHTTMILTKNLQFRLLNHQIRT